MKYDLIYDLGANVGGNLEYYLSKARKVVAVEANPELVSIIKREFSKYINQGRLVVISACLSLTKYQEKVEFFVHKFESGLGRFTTPKFEPENYRSINVESITYGEIVDIYGLPDLVKIDLEGYDKEILAHLIDNQLLPEYLIFENQGAAFLDRILKTGKYDSFNIVPFYNFSKFYYSSKKRTSGPLATDIKSPWLTISAIKDLYNQLPHAWVDIHCTNDVDSKTNDINISFYEHNPTLLLKIKKILPSGLKSFIKSLIGYKTLD